MLGPTGGGARLDGLKNIIQIYNHNGNVKQSTYQQWAGQEMQERAEEVVVEDWSFYLQ